MLWPCGLQYGERGGLFGRQQGCGAVKSAQAVTPAYRVVRWSTQARTSAKLVKTMTIAATISAVSVGMTIPSLTFSGSIFAVPALVDP